MSSISFWGLETYRPIALSLNQGFVEKQYAGTLRAVPNLNLTQPPLNISLKSLTKSSIPGGNSLVEAFSFTLEANPNTPRIERALPTLLVEHLFRGQKGLAEVT